MRSISKDPRQTVTAKSLLKLRRLSAEKPEQIKHQENKSLPELTNENVREGTLSDIDLRLNGPGQPILGQ